jgi:hypothetical protein
MSVAAITPPCLPGAIGGEARGNATFSEVGCEVAFLKMCRLADVPIGRSRILFPLVNPMCRFSAE